MISRLYFYSQLLALPQLHVTRAISGHSVPIISFVTAGIGALIRGFGPESMGGVESISARIDAETTRTGLSEDEIGPQVFIPYHDCGQTG